jgi:hypothetical protein
MDRPFVTADADLFIETGSDVLGRTAVEVSTQLRRMAAVRLYGHRAFRYGRGAVPFQLTIDS